MPHTVDRSHRVFPVLVGIPRWFNQRAIALILSCCLVYIALTYRLLLRSCKQMGAFVISPLPSFLLESLQTAGSLRPRGITPLLRYYRPLRHPLAVPPISRCLRLYGFLFSANFSAGRGGVLPFLCTSLSSCCRYNPPIVSRRFNQSATFYAAFAS